MHEIIIIFGALLWSIPAFAPELMDEPDFFALYRGAENSLLELQHLEGNKQPNNLTIVPEIQKLLKDLKDRGIIKCAVNYEREGSYFYRVQDSVEKSEFDNLWGDNGKSEK